MKKKKTAWSPERSQTLENIIDFHLSYWEPPDYPESDPSGEELALMNQEESDNFFFERNSPQIAETDKSQILDFRATEPEIQASENALDFLVDQYFDLHASSRSETDSTKSQFGLASNCAAGEFYKSPVELISPFYQRGRNPQVMEESISHQ